MSKQAAELTFDEVLDEMLASEGKIDAAVVVKWTNLYPQHKRELIDFAARFVLAESIDTQDEDSAQIEDETLNSASQIALKISQEKRTDFRQKALAMIKEQSKQPIKSILEEATASGKNIRSLAETLELSIPIVLKLENRLLEFATIPQEIIVRLSEIIKCSSEAVASYLQSERQFISGANYKSEGQPELPPKQDFSDAVRTDPNLSDEQKRRWLQ